MMTLHDGELVLHGPESTLAITGDTGAYAGARGTAAGKPAGQRDTALTLSFMP